jgi:hypothetical protein
MILSLFDKISYEYNTNMDLVLWFCGSSYCVWTPNNASKILNINLFSQSLFNQFNLLENHPLLILKLQFQKQNETTTKFD